MLCLNESEERRDILEAAGRGSCQQEAVEAAVLAAAMGVSAGVTVAGSSRQVVQCLEAEEATEVVEVVVVAGVEAAGGWELAVQQPKEAGRG